MSSDPPDCGHRTVDPNRRRASRALALGLGAGSLGLVAGLAGCREERREVAQWVLRPGSPVVEVPADFLGIHSDHGFDENTPAPTYGYGAVRSHDAMDARRYPMLHWATLETAPGIYDFRNVARWIETNPGKTRIFTLFGCPTFHQKHPGEPWAYPYLPGGGSPPRDPLAAARFVKALTDSFPGQIPFVELWNEPNFGWNDASFDARWTPDKGLPAFFTGSARDLAGMARAVRRALPPETRLMAGAWEGQDSNDSLINSLLRFSAAPDGHGGTGKDHVQVLSAHAYVYENDPDKLVAELEGYRTRFAQAGYAPDLPRYLTEIGAEAPRFWTAGSPSLRDKVHSIEKWCLIPAALGWAGVYVYKHSLMRTLGDPARTPRIAQALQWVHDEVAGARLSSLALMSDGTVALDLA